MSTRRGRFITVEGLEGAGKTTCLTSVTDFLRGAGHDPVLTREPGGTPLGEAVRGLLLGHDFTGMSTQAEILLVFAARAEHLAQVIRPALAAGRTVVCDRFTDASYAYQGGGRGLALERIRVLEEWVQQGLTPDLTLFLDVPVAVGLGRAGQRSAPDRFERERAEFFERARAIYRERASAEPQRIHTIDAGQDVAAVKAQIEDVLARVIGRDD
jgi:dTMP kinase